MEQVKNLLLLLQYTIKKCTLYTVMYIRSLDTVDGHPFCRYSDKGDVIEVSTLLAKLGVQMNSTEGACHNYSIKI